MESSKKLFLNYFYLHTYTTLSIQIVRIRIFLNPPIFLSGFKDFHVHTYPCSNQICPFQHVSDSYPDSL